MNDEKNSVASSIGMGFRRIYYDPSSFSSISILAEKSSQLKFGEVGLEPSVSAAQQMISEMLAGASE
jgi:hypothetical protein